MAEDTTGSDGARPHAEPELEGEPSTTAERPWSDPASLPQRRAGGRSWMERHLWQIQPIRDLMVASAIFLLLYIGYVVRSVTTPILLALLLAYLFEPLVRWMVKRVDWLTREMAAGAILVLSLFVIVIPLVFAAVVGVRQTITVTQRSVANAMVLSEALRADDPPAKLAEIEAPTVRRVGEFIHTTTEGENRRVIGPVIEQLWDVMLGAESWVKENAGTISKRIAGTGLNVASKVMGVATSAGLLIFTFFLTGFFFFFFSTGYGRVVDFWESLIPTERRGRTLELARKMDKVIAGFVRGRLTICAIQSGVLVVGYWAIGVPSPLVLGLLVGALTIVPYASGIGVPLAIVLMFLAPDHSGLRSETWWILIAPTVLYGLVQALDDYVLTPKIQGDATGLDTPTVLFASLAGGALAGVYGLLLAIPVAACAKIVVKEIVWPRIRAWVEGHTRDPLPIGEAVAPLSTQKVDDIDDE